MGLKLGPGLRLEAILRFVPGLELLLEPRMLLKLTLGPGLGRNWVVAQRSALPFETDVEARAAAVAWTGAEDGGRDEVWVGVGVGVGAGAELVLGMGLGVK